MNSFRSATLTLTAWYLAILMTLSISFSIVIFNISSRELDRPFPPNSQAAQYFNQFDDFQTQRQARAEEGKRNLILNLVVLNVVTLALGAGTSYVFARRTLRPIEEAMDAQSRFVSDASHELRTPLAVMRTEGEIALRAPKQSAKDLRTVVTSNLEEVERLQLLTDRLLAMSSQQSLSLAPFGLKDTVMTAVQRNLHAAADKKITISQVVADYSVNGDSETIGDIISILVDNAIKYSPSSTTITISAQEVGKKIKLTVSDEGHGIKETDTERIFERFYRSDQSRSKQHVEGHGLGLALARRLAAMNNAQLTAQNITPHGAQFTLQLDKA